MRTPTGLQFVWWRSPSDWSVGFVRMNGNWARIYEWSFQFGPLEIRRWVSC